MNTTRPNTRTTPVDIATMRETVNRLLDPDAVPEALPPTGDELQALTALVRGHLALLVPEVEAAARTLEENSVHRYTVLGCVWEARSRLETQPSPRFGGAPGYARRLARALNALCDHYEALNEAAR
ncbi:DUF6415 family natural product biosynthesis protein [Streptomyces sp. NRRL S-37]|uniref:DUF6415 family natural product biosynthesis protein n=1 Tax=Streptomyces sp. NRRL S-37 TaxID=1463903 RepID=UPI0004C8DAA2|nr:DUF6415 family natural product biosynthesis protein [Streptomyces sp. NRRL S-37]